MYSLFTLLLTLVFLVNTATAGAPATAVAPDVMTIMKKTKEAFEPMRPSKRKMVITVKSKGETAQFIVGQAIKKFPDGKRMVMVILEPTELKGTTTLIWEQENKPEDRMFIYLPALKRTKEINGLVDQYASFSGTDFTYADLGFIKLHKHYRLLGEENHGGVQAYKIEATVPKEKDYYSKTITWVAADTFLPLQRDYYDPAGELWKTELFEDVSAINGVPTPLRLKMKELKMNGSTELYLSDVEYDTAIPDSLFDPKGLPQVSAHECWQAYCSAPAQKK
jgi:outer membrane lipoprotein-sorting protein